MNWMNFISQFNKHLLVAWVLSLPLSYVITGFLDMYYTTAPEILLVAMIIHALVSAGAYVVLRKLAANFQTRRTDTLLAITLAAAILVFFVSLINMAAGFPKMFNVLAYTLPASTLTFYFIGVILSLPTLGWMRFAASHADLKRSRFYQVLDSNLGGILITLLFFSIYFLLGSIFNQPVFRFDDIFFDTDSKLYRMRFGTEQYEDYYQRTVHPYVLIIVRPWVWLVSLFLKGDMLYGAYIVTALTGALCVFLVWYFVKHSAGNSTYALLIASLFGASTSQLAFGSLIENYIFLGFTALLFMVLLLRKSPMYALVLTGLAAFGVTISNIAQTVIAHFMVKRNIPQLIKYGLIVGALIIPLNLLNNFIYPGAHPYLWAVDTLQFEEKNVFEPTFQRANYLGRVILLHSFIAPDPLLLKEDIPFVKVWLFRAALKNAPLLLAQYETTLGNALVTIWLGLVALGGLLFLKNLFKQDNGFPFAFILITLFSFALHMRYGRDVFLYSTNWTYAITLFLALAWRDLAQKRWFQSSLLAFTALVMLNNARLILFMLLASFMHIR